jgi:hypothetical protein
MSFRTLGWFGPLCPNPLPPDPPFASSPNEFKATRMYNLQTRERINEFPLDIAMKIFWEADTIAIDGFFTVEYTAQGGARAVATVAGETSVSWGAIDIFNPLFVANRPPIATAKEMLCTIQKAGNAGIHTLHETDTSFSPRMIIRILRQIWGDGTAAYAPFSINFEGAVTTQAGAQIITTSVFPENAPQVGAANWITPWGNAMSPLFFSRTPIGNVIHLDSSMTITVTAADPAVRYA